MALTEADIREFRDSLLWAMNPKVKTHLPEDLKLFVEFIEQKVEQIKGQQRKERIGTAFLKDFGMVN